MASAGIVSLPALHQACRDGDSAALVVLITSNYPDRLDLFHRLCECDTHLGWTPAHWAAYNGKVECLRRLLTCGLNTDIGESRYNRSPAQVAAFAGHPHALFLLLQAGADPNKQDGNGDTVVHHAARSGSNDCLQILHSYNAYMCLTNKEGHSPLDIAAMCGFEHSVHYLSQFQAQRILSDGHNLKRGREEDEINGEVKRLCKGSSREKIGFDNNNRKETKNGHCMDEDMEVMHEDSSFAAKPGKFPTKLSVPQRCMGSHFM